MFKKILNKLKAEKITGSAELLVNSSKNLMDALEFVRDKKERPKERNLNLSLELARSYTKYAKQKELMDKLIEVEMISLSSYITDYIKDGVSDKIGKGRPNSLRSFSCRSTISWSTAVVGITPP